MAPGFDRKGGPRTARRRAESGPRGVMRGEARAADLAVTRIDSDRVPAGRRPEDPRLANGAEVDSYGLARKD